MTSLRKICGLGRPPIKNPGYAYAAGLPKRFCSRPPLILQKFPRPFTVKIINTLSSVFVVIIQWQEIIPRQWFIKPTNLLVGTKRKHI